MARNGSGTYIRTDGTRSGSTVFADQRDANLNVDADLLDAHANDIGNEITNSIAADGQTTPTANLPMGSYRHTSVGDATARTHYAAAKQVQDGGLYYAAAGGTANAITLTLAPAITAYATGMKIRTKISSSNTGAATININGVGASAIECPNGDALIGGELGANRIVEMVYDGTNFLLTSFEPEWTDYSPTIAASGTTTISASTKVYAQYKHYGDRLLYKLAYSGITVATANGDYITVTGVKVADGEQSFGAIVNNGTTESGNVVIPNSSSTIRIYGDASRTASAWTTGSSRSFYVFTMVIRV